MKYLLKALLIILVATTFTSNASEFSSEVPKNFDDSYQECRIELSKVLSTDNDNVFISLSPCTSLFLVNNRANEILGYIFGETYYRSIGIGLSMPFLNSNLVSGEHYIAVENKSQSLSLLIKPMHYIMGFFYIALLFSTYSKKGAKILSTDGKELTIFNDGFRLFFAGLLFLPLPVLGGVNFIYLAFFAVLSMSIALANIIFVFSAFIIHLYSYKQELSKSEDSFQQYDFYKNDDLIYSSINKMVNSELCDIKNREDILDKEIVYSSKIEENVKKVSLYNCFNDFDEKNISSDAFYYFKDNESLPIHLAQTQACLVTFELQDSFDTEYCGGFSTVDSKVNKARDDLGITSVEYQKKIRNIAQKVHESECKLEGSKSGDSDVKAFNCVELDSNLKYKTVLKDGMKILSTIKTVENYRQTKQYQTDVNNILENIDSVHDRKSNYSALKRVVKDYEALFNEGGIDKVDNLIGVLKNGFLDATVIFSVGSLYERDEVAYQRIIDSVYSFRVDYNSPLLDSLTFYNVNNVNNVNSTNVKKNIIASSFDGFNINEFLERNKFFNCIDSMGIQSSNDCSDLSINPLSNISELGKNIVKVALPLKILTSISKSVVEKTERDLNREMMYQKEKGIKPEQIKKKSVKNISKKAHSTILGRIFGISSDISSKFSGVISILYIASKIMESFGIAVGYIFPAIPFFIYLSLIIGWLLQTVKTFVVLPFQAILLALPSQNQEDFMGSETQIHKMFLSTILTPVFITLSPILAFVLIHFATAIVDSTYLFISDEFINSNGGLVNDLTYNAINFMVYTVIMLIVIYKSSKGMIAFVSQLKEFFGLNGTEEVDSFDKIAQIAKNIMFFRT